MLLYGTDASPFVARVRVQIAYKGLRAEIVRPPGGPGSAQMRALNPLGRIPVLETEGRRIAESAVIAEYLEDRYPTPGLRGRSPGEAAAVRLVCRVVDSYLVPALQPLRAVLLARRAAATTAGTSHEAALEVPAAAVGDLRAALDGLEGCLAGGPFAAVDSFSLADCALAPTFFYIDRFTGALLPDFRRAAWPRTDACLRQLATLPTVAGILDLMESALSPPSGASAEGGRA
jgi:glutathione S-transferase